MAEGLDNPKLFAALLNGVFKRLFENDESITPEVLYTEVFSESVPIEAITKLCEISSRVMMQSAYKNWELARLEELLTKSPFSQIQQEIFIRFWKMQKPNVHQMMVGKSKWNNSLLQFVWRIDVKTKSRNIEQMNEPTAIAELTIGSPSSTIENKQNSLIRFEMSKDQLEKIVHQIEEIEKKLASFSS